MDGSLVFSFASVNAKSRVCQRAHPGAESSFRFLPIISRVTPSLRISSAVMVFLSAIFDFSPFCSIPGGVGRYIHFANSCSAELLLSESVSGDKIHQLSGYVNFFVW
jgi:hypothetical protein